MRWYVLQTKRLNEEPSFASIPTNITCMLYFLSNFHSCKVTPLEMFLSMFLRIEITKFFRKKKSSLRF
uniref:Dihydrolipoyllysine-residue acetyltransferase component 4 of pyruvate dehydrogenase complexic n=1 Tax=Rhizophora mucronata TaxID=61149 RepID=A0A2P2LTU4_RHIMU